MSWNDHDHRGEYAEARHSHFGEYAEERHYHHDLEHADESAQREIRGLREDISELRRQLDDALDRIAGLEKQTPQARQLQLEADQAAADLAGSGYDRHGRDCQCPFCYYDPEDDDQAGPSLHRAGVCWCGDLHPSADLAALYNQLEGMEEPEPEERDPGPEVDDEGGMSEYRYLLPEDYERGQS